MLTKNSDASVEAVILQSSTGVTNDETSFKSSRTFRVPGNRTSDFPDGTAVTITYGMGYSKYIKDGAFKEQYHFLPGESPSGVTVLTDLTSESDTDNVVGTPVLPYETQMCPLADDFGAGAYPGATDGPTPKFLADLDSQYYDSTTSNDGEGFRGLIIKRFGRNSLVCCENSHVLDTVAYAHKSATKTLLTKWRDVVAKIKTDANANTLITDFFVMSDYGPADWMVGSMDGYVRAGYRNDLATSKASWGQAGLFPQRLAVVSWQASTVETWDTET